MIRFICVISVLSFLPHVILNVEKNLIHTALNQSSPHINKNKVGCAAGLIHLVLALTAKKII